jgi:hypothetical protein
MLGSHSRVQSQPWLANSSIEMAFILAPAFVSSAFVLAFHRQIEQTPALPLWAWVCFVLLVDVAHVYATMFRTYFDKNALGKNGVLLTTIPVLCWVCGSLLYSVNDLLFWRVLAYLAVFHFIRQQYGFVVLYARKDPACFKNWIWLDAAIVYVAAIYPLLFWHTRLPRLFSWFVDGDFIGGMPAVIAEIGLIIYGVIAAAYIVKELILTCRSGFFNIPRNLIIAGTALSWWVGIIAFNSDLAFTITNVVSHGIPYMALVWLYHHRGNQGKNEVAGRSASLVGLALSFAPLFLLMLALFAYLEEGLWDALVWREHANIFAAFYGLPAITESTALALLVPLLALPQSTHYVLDGFIWRVKGRTSVWSA